MPMTYARKRASELRLLKKARATHNFKSLIKTHQVALVCARRGIEMPGFRRPMPPLVRELMHRHVYPLLPQYP